MVDPPPEIGYSKRVFRNHSKRSFRNGKPLARPRKVSDEAVFAAAFRVITRVGPRDFSLEAIAREAGVTPAALIQRYGSKRALQLALAAQAEQSAPTFFDDLRAAHTSPLAALRAYASCMAELASSPAAFVRNLAYLLEDLSDAGLRHHLARQSRGNRT